MNAWLYLLARGLVTLVQCLPLRGVARLGRAIGALVFWCDARHRRVALKNLTLCFGAEMMPGQVRALAKENFRRIGENFACAIKTAAMSPEQLRRHFEVVHADRILSHQTCQGPQNRIVAIGHFGNFELYARVGQVLPVFQCATTYRGLRQPWLDRLVQSLRERSGCRYFERRTDATALKACMADTGLLLGLLADQRAAHGGTRLPFFGREASTSLAPAVFALRYRCPLHVAICYRVGLARWRIEFEGEIPTRVNGEPRPAEALMRDVNAVFETAIRRDPANWFWVHDRWRPSRSGGAASAASAQTAVAVS